MNRLLCLLLLAISSACVSFGAEPKGAGDASALVTALYQTHRGGEGDLFNKAGANERLRYFDARLAGLIAKEAAQAKSSDVGKLDFDALYNAQDMKLANLKVAAAAIEGERATVVVSFTNYGKKTSVTCRLRQTSAGWRISDIEYGKGETLAGILSAPN